MSKKKDNKNSGKIDPVYEAILNQAPSDNFGKGYITEYWKAIFLLIPLLPYFGLYFSSTIVHSVSIGYSSLFIIIFVIIVIWFNRDMSYNINPFDYLTFQLIVLAMITIHYGLLYYSIDAIFKSFLSESGNSSILDFIYYSIGIITTAGSDLKASSDLSKLLSISELLLGIWIFVTIIPIAVGFQAERFRELVIARNKANAELQKAVREGRWKKIELTEEEIMKEIKKKKPKEKKKWGGKFFKIFRRKK